jgi:hypothetical protein
VQLVPTKTNTINQQTYTVIIIKPSWLTIACAHFSIAACQWYELTAFSQMDKDGKVVIVFDIWRVEFVKLIHQEIDRVELASFGSVSWIVAALACFLGG